MPDQNKKIEVEYEATFLEIDEEKARTKLKDLGATLVYSKFLQKRAVFLLPVGHEIKGGWVRVRSEKEKTTMSLKIVDGGKITDQREVALKIDDFDKGVLFLTSIGCQKKAFQETKRELWMLDNVEITIDEWPFLEPYIEIEGKSEEEIKEVSKKLGFDYQTAFFGSADGIYSKRYGLPVEVINDQTPLITFDMENPFLVHQKKQMDRML